MQLQVFAVGAEIDVLRFIIRKSVPFQLRCGAVMNWLGTDKEINAVLLQYAVSQWEIIGGVRCRSLEGNHVFVDMLYLLQIWGGIVDIPRRYSQADDDAIVRINGLVREVMLSPRLAGAVHVPRFRVCAAHTLVCPALVTLNLLGTPLPPPACPAGQLLQPFLLIGIQPLPVYPGLLRHFCQILRFPGCVCLYMGGIRRRQPPAHQAPLHALTHHFLEQPPEYLPKTRLSPEPFPRIQTTNPVPLPASVKSVPPASNPLSLPCDISVASPRPLAP